MIRIFLSLCFHRLRRDFTCEETNMQENDFNTKGKNPNEERNEQVEKTETDDFEEVKTSILF